MNGVCRQRNTGVVVDLGWEWDPSLYAGSAAYYVRGRIAYPRQLVEALSAELGLDGSGRLLDVGCGPGSLILLLADRFEHAIGLDADAGMLAEAARQAQAAGITNVDWIELRAEDITAELGHFRAVTFAQSFHWMDRARVARSAHGLVRPDGAVVHVHATTHEGIDTDVELPHPRPPRRAIGDLIERSLGSRRRAGRTTLPTVPTDEDERGRLEAKVYRAAGFSGPTRLEVPGAVVTRTTDEVVASVFSLSSAAPHLFGARIGEFEAALRELLAVTSPDGVFSEQMRESAVDVWRT